MKIEKLPSGSWRVRKTIDKKTYSVVFDHKPTKKEYERALEEKRGSSKQKSIGHTFQECAENFLQINENTLKPSTQRGYSSVLRALPESFRSKDIDYIENTDIQSLINDKALTVSSKTCGNYRGFISVVMGMYRPDFKVNVRIPVKKRYDKYVPTTDEVNAVLDVVRGTQFEVCYRVLMYGLRRGECAALQLTDLDDDDYLTINKAYSQGPDNKWVLMDTPKTVYSNRKIQIDHELAEMIRKQGYIYKGSIDYMYEHLQRIQKRLGQHHWRLHDYRAYMCTELSHAGISESAILAVGGWGSPNIMRSVYRKSRYSQDEKTRDDVIKILSQNCHEN